MVSIQTVSESACAAKGIRTSSTRWGHSGVPAHFKNLEIHQTSQHATLIFSLLEVLHNVLLISWYHKGEISEISDIPKTKSVSFELEATPPHPDSFPNRLNYFDLAGLTTAFIPINCTLPFDSCTNRLRADGYAADQIPAPGLACNGIFIHRYTSVHTGTWIKGKFIYVFLQPPRNWSKMSC